MSDYERQPRDYYRTPPWVVEYLFSHLPLVDGVVWEPAAGADDMGAAMRNLGMNVMSTDIEPQSDRVQHLDFFDVRKGKDVEAIITNPPFRTSEEFCRRALSFDQVDTVALLLPYEWDTAGCRLDLFRDEPRFLAKIILPKRISWLNFEKKASPRQVHAWYVWDRQNDEPPTILYPHEKSA
jgi:hypothetical protein